MTRTRLKTLGATLIAAAVAIAPTTASAQARPYIEATAATNQIESVPNSTDDFAFGARLGLEVSNLTFDLSAENPSDPVFGANVGLTGKLVGPFGIYGQAGVLKNDSEIGYRLGTGLKMGLTKHTYLRAGLQRDDYGNGVDSLGAIGALGLRF